MMRMWSEGGKQERKKLRALNENQQARRTASIFQRTFVRGHDLGKAKQSKEAKQKEQKRRERDGREQKRRGRDGWKRNKKNQRKKGRNNPQ